MEGLEIEIKAYNYIKEIQRQCGHNAITIDFSKLDAVTKSQLRDAMRNVICRREKEIWQIIQGDKNS